MLVDLSNAQERERRMGEIVNRLGALEPSKVSQLQTMLNAQQVIDRVTDPTNSPLGAPNEALQKELTNSLAGRSETIKANMTQLLGFTPSKDDIKELVKIQNSFGGSLTEAANVVAKNINQVEGGINSFLRSIDTGITAGLTAATTAASNLLASAQKEAESAVKSLLPSPSSFLPTGTLSQLTDVLNDTTALANRVTDMVTSQVNSAIGEVDTLMSNISSEINTAAKSFVGSAVISDQVTGVQNAISSSVNSVPTPPIPANADGQQPAVVPLQPPTDVSAAPIVPPVPLSEPAVATAMPVAGEEVRVKSSDEYISNVYYPTAGGGRYIPIITRIVTRRVATGDYVIRLLYFNYDSVVNQTSSQPILNSATTIAVKPGNPRATRAFYTATSNLSLDALRSVSPSSRDIITAPSSVEEIVESFAIPTNVTTRAAAVSTLTSAGGTASAAPFLS